MRIVQIIPGSGGTFYCQNCLRDMDITTALRAQGHDVLVVPLYLPLTAGDANVADGRIFYSAVGTYVKHQYPRLARIMPGAFLRMLETQAVLRMAAKFSSSTRAAGLADLTVSMLRGEEGRQADELENLVAWLRDDAGSRPDVICLSNCLLLGLARRLKAVLGVPVVCWLQDEHVWVDAMPPDESAQVWQAMHERAADVDAFISVSHAYAKRMSAKLAVPPERIRTIHMGVDPKAYRQADPDRKPRTIGFLSRLAEGEGFGRFVEAFILLHRDPRFADVRLSATGGVAGRGTYVKKQWKRLRDAGLADLAEIEPNLFQTDRASFLEKLMLLSVPVPGGEAFGTYVIEAMSAGVPVIEPPVGAYSEIFAQAGCGVSCASEKPEDLVAAWAALLEDSAKRKQEIKAGHDAVARYFNLNRMARETAGFYRELCK